MNFLLIVAAVSLFILIECVFDHRRMNKIVDARGMPNICKFVRDFDYRTVDTRIIREVWNELQDYLGRFQGRKFPVQSEDRFRETYRMDEDDLDDIYWDICDRLAISSEQVAANPYYDRVHSVKDLVAFIHHQQKEQSTC